MKFALSLILFIALVPGLASGVAAQSGSGSAPAVDDLRVKLLEVQAKETELQARERQLDENLKPENIERSLAGVGSTRPEELRELRRRQLDIERESVRTQLRLVGTSRERLESAIRTAEAKAYQESAEGNTTLLNQLLGTQNPRATRWLVRMFAGLVAILGIVFVVAVIRRLKV